jgi:hypothetical protein
VDKRCPHCEDRLIEIDHYGDRLIGCVTCNCWMGEDEVLVQLDQAEIIALRGRVKAKLKERRSPVRLTELPPRLSRLPPCRWTTGHLRPSLKRTVVGSVPQRFKGRRQHSSISAQAHHGCGYCAGCSAGYGSDWTGQRKARNAAHSASTDGLLRGRAARNSPRQGEDDRKNKPFSHTNPHSRETSGSGANWQELGHRSRREGSKNNSPVSTPTQVDEAKDKILLNSKRGEDCG